MVNRSFASSPPTEGEPRASCVPPGKLGPAGGCGAVSARGGEHGMPSILAVLTASMAAVVFSRLPLEFIGFRVHAILDLMVWVAAFILMKRFVTNIRP